MEIATAVALLPTARTRLHAAATPGPTKRSSAATSPGFGAKRLDRLQSRDEPGVPVTLATVRCRCGKSWSSDEAAGSSNPPAPTPPRSTARPSFAPPEDQRRALMPLIACLGKECWQ